MTDEILTQANNLKHTIRDLEAQIAIAEDMHHCDNNLTLEVDTIGAITIAGDELKDDIIDLVLNKLNTKKEEAEDEYRRL